MSLNIRLIISVFGLAVILQSCCFGAKEHYLGNNMYLSEYDNLDRRILYQEESCATSGFEIVPMTVMEIAHDSEWIIAKSGSRLNKTNDRYWVINNSYSDTPDSKTIKQNTIEFGEYSLFKSFLVDNNIGLELEEIK